MSAPGALDIEVEWERDEAGIEIKIEAEETRIELAMNHDASEELAALVNALPSIMAQVWDAIETQATQQHTNTDAEEAP